MAVRVQAYVAVPKSLRSRSQAHQEFFIQAADKSEVGVAWNQPATIAESLPWFSCTAIPQICVRDQVAALLVIGR